MRTTLQITATFLLLLLSSQLVSQDFYSSAKTLYDSDVFESAIDFIDAKEGPLTAREWKLKADCYHKLERYHEATEAYTESIIMSPGDAEAIARRGATYLESGELGFAISDVKKALKISPTLAEAHFVMGNICYDQGDMSGAIKSYTKALANRLDYPAARYMLGAAHSQNGDHAAASTDFEAVVHLFPTARYNMAVVELENENYPKAIALFNDLEAEGMETTADFYFFRAEAHYLMGMKEEACKDYYNAGELGDEESKEFHENYCLKGNRKGKAKKREVLHLEF